MRLFTAIPLPDEVRRHLCAMQQELNEVWNMAGVKWTAPQNLHVTLKFLGEVPDDSLVPLIDSLRAVRVMPAMLVVDHITGFPKRGPARIVAGALGGQCRHVGLLFDQIERACESMGIARDRRAFVPHITLGRSRGGIDFSRHEAPPGLPGPSFTAAGFELVKSELTESGPIYSTLEQFEAR